MCGNAKSDHNTLNRFRSDKAAPVLKDIFKLIVLPLAPVNLVSRKEIYVEHTKIEANAIGTLLFLSRQLRLIRKRLLSNLMKSGYLFKR